MPADRTPIGRAIVIGPDPGELTDAEIYEIAGRLAALAMRVAGRPGGAISAREVADLPPVEKYLYRTLRASFEILVGENNRREQAEADALHDEIAAFLAEHP